MLLYRVVIETTSNFVTPLKGDTLFGQFCWAYREKYGRESLESVVLAGYTENKPKIIFSDAYMHDYLLLPKYVYSDFGDSYDATKRKEIKSKKYLLQKQIFDSSTTLKQIWHDTINACGIGAVNAKTANIPAMIDTVQTHNTINRNLGSTSSGVFAPYNSEGFTYQRLGSEVTKLDIFVMLDENFFQQLGLCNLEELINNIGSHGFGADASIGKGKFRISLVEDINNLNYSNINSGITLAPVIIDTKIDKIKEVYYDIFTRFGRHGNMMAHSKQVFKQPVTLMNSNACIIFENSAPQYIGNGLINNRCQLEDESHDGYIQAYSMIIPLRIN